MPTLAGNKQLSFHLFPHRLRSFQFSRKKYKPKASELDFKVLITAPTQKILLWTKDQTFFHKKGIIIKIIRLIKYKDSCFLLKIHISLSFRTVLDRYWVFYQSFLFCSSFLLGCSGTVPCSFCSTVCSSAAIGVKLSENGTVSYLARNGTV